MNDPTSFSKYRSSSIGQHGRRAIRIDTSKGVAANYRGHVDAILVDGDIVIVTKKPELRSAGRRSFGKFGATKANKAKATAYHIFYPAEFSVSPVEMKRLVYKAMKHRRSKVVAPSVTSFPEIDLDALLVNGEAAVVTEGRIAAEAYTPNARARAILRGFEIAEGDLREAGGAFNLSEVTQLMHGVSRQRIEQRVKERSLLAVPGPSGRRRYPTAQFTPEGGVIEGLRDVLSAFPTNSPWMMLNFLVNPDSRLNGKKPLDVLKQGDVGRVVEAAKSVGVQGA
jgi:hypothetical protein